MRVRRGVRVDFGRHYCQANSRRYAGVSNARVGCNGWCEWRSITIAKRFANTSESRTCNSIEPDGHDHARAKCYCGHPCRSSLRSARATSQPRHLAFHAAHYSANCWQQRRERSVAWYRSSGHIGHARCGFIQHRHAVVGVLDFVLHSGVAHSRGALQRRGHCARQQCANHRATYWKNFRQHRHCRHHRRGIIHWLRDCDCGAVDVHGNHGAN